LPLAIGNSWRYTFARDERNDPYPNDPDQRSWRRVDSGIVVVAVSGASHFRDSVLWHFHEVASFRRKSWHGADPTAENDGVVEQMFDVREMLSGDHELCPRGTSEVFRFGSELTALQASRIVVNRYVKPDTGMALKFHSSNPFHDWRFTFHSGIGLEAMVYSSDFFIYHRWSSIGLLSQNLLAVKSPSQEEPQAFELKQNYPNPFNPSTTIQYVVGGARDQGSGVNKIRLAVYDLLGREVAELVNEKKAPGSYEVRFDASGLASGVYFYRMQTGDFVQTRKLLRIR